MFTGIVQAIGQLVEIRAADRDRDLIVENALVAEALKVGDSVALDGVCQTVTRRDGACFEVHAIAETLRVTTLGRLQPGDRLNLELPLASGAPIGGHFVQGHVDGTATIVAQERCGESIRLGFRAAPDLVRQLVPKGSVAIDGISLTVGPELQVDRFEVFLIPHTLEVTTLGSKPVGARVNLETDILGKYVQRYLELGRSDPASARRELSLEDLRRSGFGAGSSPEAPYHGEEGRS